MPGNEDQVHELVQQMYKSAEDAPWALNSEEVRAQAHPHRIMVPDTKVLSVAFGAIALAVVGVLFFTLSPNPHSSAVNQNLSPTSSIALPPLKPTTTTTTTASAQPGILPPTTTTLPPTTTVPPTTSVPVTTLPGTSGFRLGISDDRQGPFTSSQFSGVNSWAAQTGNTVTAVVAGGKPSVASDPFNSPKLAAVFVYTEPVTRAAGAPVSTPVGIFAPAVDPTGEFSITAATGNILTLAISGNPTVYYFDVATQSFS